VTLGHFELQQLMKRRVHLAYFAVLIALSAAPVYGAAAASVSGLVRNSAGVPQIGAVVQLLRPDLSVVASVYTNEDGRFAFSTVMPGRYALKAMAVSFLPSLRENVRVHAGTIVNLTLNTLYEAIQWLPAQPRSRSAQKDDWVWTLRSAANRPLLRWLEDGPLVVVSDGSGAPKLKARLMATGQSGTFGENGQRISAEVQDTPTGSRELLARVDFASDTSAGMESMLGFRQDLGFAGSVQSVAAVAIHPEVGTGSAGGFDEAAVRSSETMNLGPALQAEVGTTEVVAHLGGSNPATMTAALPYANVDWHEGDSTVNYRLATFVPGPGSAGESQPDAWLPQFSASNGALAMERGMHQEIGWERQTENSGMSVVFYSDKIENPVLESVGNFSQGSQAAASIEQAALVDRTSGLLNAAGPDFSSTGVRASIERRLPGGNDIRLSYANGDALVMPALPQPVEFAQLVAAAHPRHAQTYTISLSGTLDGTKTCWHASYRWQPDSTMTAVDPYAQDGNGPYLNVYIRQPIHLRGAGPGGFEALVDVSNLLAEGYHPYLLNDGSLLIFAQSQRIVRGGLAFTF
jgi:Carboxypeptidase regulatory-like domain